MPNFKRQKAIMSAIDWDVDHMRDRIKANAENLSLSTSTSLISSPLATTGGAVVGADGHVYFIPETNDYVMKLHPDNDSIVHKDLGNAVYTYSDGVVYDGSTQISMYDGDGRLNVGVDGSMYMGGVLAPNGHIYCIPYSAHYVMKIDTNYGSETYGKPSRIETEITEADAGVTSAKWVGGVLAPNGKIYCAPYNAKWVLVIDTKTDTISYLGKDDTSYEFSSTNTGRDTYQYRGAVLHPQGHVIFVPYYASKIARIKLKNDSVTFETNALSSSTTELTSTSQYRGGVYDPKTDYVILIPYSKNIPSYYVLVDDNYDFVLYFDNSNYSIPDDARYDGGVLAPNGNIYFIPCDADRVYACANDLSASGLCGNTGLSDYKWGGGVLAPNGCIYSAPYACNGPYILKISPNPTANLNFGLSTILSPYLNKF